jgi:hypothetical protein
MRRNTYDATSGVDQPECRSRCGSAQVAKHYADLLVAIPALDALREQYAMPANILRDALTAGPGSFLLLERVVGSDRPPGRKPT